MGYKVERKELNLLEKAYVPEILKGMGVSTRHLVRNLFGRKDTVTHQYPDVPPEFAPRYRGHHRLTYREDGRARCVACMLCSTACPANCITIQAGDYGDSEVEKYPVKFEIDLLVCVYCGMCEEACPCDAIRMDSGVQAPSQMYRKDSRVTKPDLLALGDLSIAKQGGTMS